MITLIFLINLLITTVVCFMAMYKSTMLDKDVSAWVVLYSIASGLTAPLWLAYVHTTGGF